MRIALSGEEGIEFASDFRPQLIPCDFSLPDMGGHEVIRRLRSNPDTRHAYSVILTAHSEAEIRSWNDEAQELGVDEFIRKPLMPEVAHSLGAKAHAATSPPKRQLQCPNLCDSQVASLAGGHQSHSANITQSWRYPAVKQVSLMQQR